MSNTANTTATKKKPYELKAQHDTAKLETLVNMYLNEHPEMIPLVEMLSMYDKIDTDKFLSFQYGELAEDKKHFAHEIRGSIIHKPIIEMGYHYGENTPFIRVFDDRKMCITSVYFSDIAEFMFNKSRIVNDDGCYWHYSCIYKRKYEFIKTNNYDGLSIIYDE